MQDAGYEVTGVTFLFHGSDDDRSHIDDARRVADRLGIRHFVHDAREAFRHAVVDYFVHEYMAGRTPVPCTVCNNLLKWPLLCRLADREGIPLVATGHYVRICAEGGRHYVTQGVDPDKDQSFFLWGLPQETLARALFPLGTLAKAEVRRLAAGRGFRRVAEKRDSLGVCFCPGDYRPFLRRQAEAGAIRPGMFVDEEGNALGMHEGYPFYTVGQRRGLGIHLNRAVYVKAIDPQANRVTLAPLSSLERTEMSLGGWRLVCPEEVLDGSEVEVKIRYRKQLNHATVSLRADGRLHVSLREPLTGIAPGQAAVFYRGGRVLGGGIIEGNEG